MADFIPKQDTPRLIWLKNLKTRLPDHVAALDITPERATAVLALIDAHIAAIELVTQKKNEWLGASSIKKNQARTTLAGLRTEIARWKTAPGANDGSIAELQLSASLPAVDALHLRPELAVVVSGGHVVIKFKKRGASDVNIYVRHPGDTAWRLLVRVTKSPCHDRTPLAKPGVPETREYQAIGLKHDREVGQPSQIVIVTLAG
jgi:hypothetical protein